MSSFLFHNKNISINKLEKYLNLTGNLILQSKIYSDKNFSVSSLRNPPIKGDRILENDNWIILFSGDIVEYSSVPFNEIISNIENNKFENFSKFNGIFCVIAYHKQTEFLYAISDRRAQYPVFYFINNGSLIFTSELSLLTYLIEKPVFNEEWLYEYLYFNFPIMDTTFLKNVQKLIPATCFKIDMKNGKQSQIKYANNYSRYENLIDGNDALAFAAETLKKRIPVYFKGGKEVACAFTSGWDGRTNLALAPKDCNL
ncbi:MAG TPA: hypothetical protein VLN45_11780 [Ignavibacteriaceae bacterium]|nr:hypothetical protein [Ignavibacteriaceae bacterium]